MTLFHTDSPTLRGGHDELILLPSLRAHAGPHGGVVLTQKFLNGVAQYASVWPGRVTTLIQLRDEPTSDMDHVEVFCNDANPRIEVRPEAADALRDRIRNAAAVLMFLGPFEYETVRMCAKLGVPVIFWTEFSPRTERQIIDSETPKLILRLRRKLWVAKAEYRRRRMLRLAAGVQCSGTPVYEAYRRFNPNPLLFFDSRVPNAQVIDPVQLAEKSAYLAQQRPLRIVFGGRLVAMKGVLDLLLVAKALRRMGVAFQLDIYGRGALEKELVRNIAEWQLGDCVALRGVLDFGNEWIPMLKREADIFLCCHPQGDPSSTYPEVMSCGVPIVGYDNEAFAGIVQHSNSGWLSPMHDAVGLARIIARLSENRGEIVRAARFARDFAAEHSFEKTFALRAHHVIALSRLPEPVRSAFGAMTPQTFLAA